jgi:DNA-binding NtrC family response regulator
METSTNESKQPSTVLVVDDERGPRLALQLILQREFRVVTAQSGEEALEILKNEPVEAVTLDLKMPGLAGQNTLSLIRGMDPDLPVIIITGYGSYESAVKALKLRAFDYVAKPFDSKKILMVVENAVEDRRRAMPQKAENPIARLDAVLEAADSLERSRSEWLSNPDRAALDCIRTNVRAIREHFRSSGEEDNQAVDFFEPRKEHG